jgi:hypothetical protein
MGYPDALGEFPCAFLHLRKMQGSFDSAGTSLRELPAALRMTTFITRSWLANATGRPEIQAAGVSAALARLVGLTGRQVYL